MSTRSSSGVLAPDQSGISECLDRLAAQKRAKRPVSTYRLQFHRGFRFADARGLAGYLDALGITHCYASPILKARAGSTHGYDITDHNQLNPEIGSEEEFHALVDELKTRGMGLVLDTVPNHMGIGGGDNPWWQDVLENGRASEYADFFDIDWRPVKAELAGKVLVPILGDAYGEELEQGRIQLVFAGGCFSLRYYDNWMPIDPQTFPMIFEPLGDLRVPRPGMTPSEEDRTELENVQWNLRRLPSHDIIDTELVRRRQRDIPELKRRLRELSERSPEVRELVQEAVRLSNGQPGNARSFDALHRLLEAQAYRLASWRVSAQEINYRRFFDINDLVGLRMDNPRVFAATHKLLRRLLAEGSVSGVRLDHPDGLLNPVQYFTRVQMLNAASQCVGAHPEGPLAENGIELAVQEIFGQHDWMGAHAPLWVVAEKVLGPGEHLPQEWPVDGTVGYDFLRLVNGIFIDQRQARAFTNIYRRFIGGPVDVDLQIYQNKKLIMASALSSEVTVLSHMLEELASGDRKARDFTRPALTEAIRETIACFPVYRTYVDERGAISERDRAYINRAITLAKRRNPGTPGPLFDWLRALLLLEDRNSAGMESHRQRLQFLLKFQQLTGPVMGKGLEDTVCYVHNRFIAVNEVGCTPAEFGISVDEFHRGNRERGERWPFSMLTTSTHDAKRSEDVRARLDVLSEMPREWSAEVTRWRRLNRARKRTLADGRTVPDLNEEYFFYQTLVGAWPLRMESRPEREEFLGRLQRYMNKAAHEAKVNLSWVNPDPEYSAALEEFIALVLASDGGRPHLFLRALERFLPPVMFFGCMNSLAQVLLKTTLPGVPDVYQGNELWEFNLVDPDNRRPVDFELRQRLVSELEVSAQNLPALCGELLANWRDGRLKLWTTLRSLQLRREHASLFQAGSYQPLYAAGERQEHVVAFAREYEGRAAVVVVPRLACTLMRSEPQPPLGDVWGDTQLELPPGHTDFVNTLTGQAIASIPTLAPKSAARGWGTSGRTLLCREVFAHFPVALLTSR